MSKIDRRELAAIFAGGCFGGLLRTGLADWAATPAGDWPWATFAVNIAAAFLLGYFVARPHGIASSSYVPALLGPGFCGALSTFSTMQVELLGMLDTGEYGLASGYLTLSVAVGFLAARIARGIVHRTGLTT